MCTMHFSKSRQLKQSADKRKRMFPLSFQASTSQFPVPIRPLQYVPSSSETLMEGQE